MPDPLITRSAQHPRLSSRDELVRALTGCDVQEGLAVSRTRRVVHGAVIHMAQQKTDSRKKTGLVLLAALLITTLLAPALWSSVDSFAAGNHFVDLQTQVYLLGVMLFPGIVAAAIAGFSRQRGNNR